MTQEEFEALQVGELVRCTSAAQLTASISELYEVTDIAQARGPRPRIFVKAALSELIFSTFPGTTQKLDPEARDRMLEQITRCSRWLQEGARSAGQREESGYVQLEDDQAAESLELFTGA